MSALRPVENEKYVPKLNKHKYVSITSATEAIADKKADAAKPIKIVTKATKNV